MSLVDRVALITGADSESSVAIALRLARDGAMLVLNDLTSTRLDRAAREIVEVEGRRALIALGDVRRPAHVERVVRDAVEAFGRIDILVCTAGGEGAVEAAELCARAVLGPMRERRWGRVINTASSGGLGAGPQDLIALTRTLALEAAIDGVTVNCVVCGVTAPAPAEPAAMAEPAMPAIPMGRAALPREIAAAHAFLASDDAAYVTGQVLHVDGGLSVLE